MKFQIVKSGGALPYFIEDAEFLLDGPANHVDLKLGQRMRKVHEPVGTFDLPHVADPQNWNIAFRKAKAAVRSLDEHSCNRAVTSVITLYCLLLIHALWKDRVRRRRL
jgi:hypothetical protein